MIGKTLAHYEVLAHLGSGDIDGTTYNHAYDVMPGGEQAIWISNTGTGQAQADLRVVLGWRSEVERRLGAR